MNRHHKKLVSAICILLAVLMALSLILMAPLRYVLGMYRKRKPREGGELL